MIFVYPAIISPNVDREIVPAAAKLVEQYFLLHTVVAINTGNLRVIIDGTKDPKKPVVTVEQDEYTDKELSVIHENICLQEGIDPEEDEDDEQIKNRGKSKRDQETQDKRDAAKAEVEKGKLEVAKQRERRETDKERREREKEEKESARTKAARPLPGGKADIKTWDQLGFAPTMVPVEVSVIVRGKYDEKLFTDIYGSEYHPTKDQLEYDKMLEPRFMLMGTKVIPMVAKNIDSMYNLLRNDYYSNYIGYLYKMSFRGVVRFLYNTSVLTKLRQWMSYYLKIGSSPSSWYTDILLSKAGFLDSSAFQTNKGSPAYQRYSGSIIMINKDEKEDLFSDPVRIQKLFKMGWKSFLIFDPRAQRCVFCSHVDRGLCMEIPYAFMFRALNAEQVYKSIQDLERATGGVFRRGNLKNLKNLLKR
jgi:hypothetical protein